MTDPDFDPYLPPQAPVGFKATTEFTTDAIEGNPWAAIWTRPRATIRGIVDTYPSRCVTLLAMIYGISSTLNSALQRESERDEGNATSLPAILGLALIAGSIGGVIGNLIMGALVRWTGSWIGGVASAQECRAAIAWGSVPQAVNLALVLGLIGVFGNDLFRSVDLEATGRGKAAILIAVGLAQIVLGIWSAVLTVKCIAEVHRFSAWKSLGALLLVGLVFLGAILIIVLVVFALMVIMNVR
jgi:hypothetical protein